MQCMQQLPYMATKAFGVYWFCPASTITGSNLCFLEPATPFPVEQAVKFIPTRDDINHTQICSAGYSSPDDRVKPKMNCSVKIFVSWVMILNLTLGFMPVSFALDLGSSHHVTSFELISSNSTDRDQTGSFEGPDFIGCQDFAVCTMHYSCSPLHSSAVMTVTPHTLVHCTIALADVRVLTRYLVIPLRPPRT